MFSHPFRRWILLLSLCLSLAPSARAFQRVVLSPGATIRSAPLIVIADSSYDGANYQTIVTVKAVLKGEKKWLDQKLIFALTTSMSRFVLPREGKGFVLFLESSPPASTDPFAVLEAFQEPEKIAATKILIPIYALPSERAQLLALRELWPDENALIRAQFVGDLGALREAKNFDLLLDFFPQSDVATKKQLIERLGRIGDTRALPLLIATMKDPKTPDNLRYSASWQLNFYFPGAPGVTEAFREVFPWQKAICSAWREII